MIFSFPSNSISLYLRLRQSGKKKKKLTLHVKRPGARKDEMKLALLKLKTIVQHEQTDGGPTASLNEGQHDRGSESDKGSLGLGQEESIIL